MATIGSPPENDSTSNYQQHQILRHDRDIDLEYVKEGSSADDYAKEPWNHYKDALSSYLSVRFAYQDDFSRKVKDETRSRIEHEKSRIMEARENFFSHPSKKKLRAELHKAHQQWKDKVVAELEQIQNERREAVDKNYKGDRDKIKRWDSEHFNQLKQWVKDGVSGSSANRGRIFGRRSKQQRPPSPQAGGQTEQPTTNIHQETNDPYYGFKAGAMYFKRTEVGLVGYQSENQNYQGSKFPNQKIPMRQILEPSGDNPLIQPCPVDTVRYFHFPTNNMEWIEQAIEMYYHSKGNQGKKDKSKILAREYWEGQMHGSGPTNQMARIQGSLPAFGPVMSTPGLDTRRGVPVHARHMRSKCSLIPREPVPKTIRSLSSPLPEAGMGEHSPKVSVPRTPSIAVPLLEKNIALFLPYLHWETSSRRAQMVKVINHAMGNDPSQGKKKPTLFPVVQKLRGMQGKIVVDQKDRDVPLTRRQLLGIYLMILARMAEEMDYEADERLLREKVVNTPPLHIRRTLDQYYFPNLDNTSERDRDQVVYRGTISRRLSTRVVMVDQLWLWILDDNTIITSFPRRWGRNKPDPSGVHKSLRERLGRKTEAIKSVHHLGKPSLSDMLVNSTLTSGDHSEYLAMIIIDQCSRVFFDRTQPLDQRPEVMDLFAAAIGNVTEHTRIAYDNFWEHTKLDFQNLIPTSNKAVRHKYLDINPEGIILKEAQDIAEELMIMKRVYAEQVKVVKDFMQHLMHPHGKHAAVTSEAILINTLMTELRKLTLSAGEDEGAAALETQFDEESVHEARTLAEMVQARQAEIMDLEEAALRACAQLEGLLALKQQQASIVEARAALQRADESVSQGRTIQAFTIITIIFLPLGFFATFFGMNNYEINNAEWMSLWDQIKWMFGLSIVVIAISVSLAFSAWVRAVARLAFEVPLAFFFEMTNIRRWWKGSMWNHTNLERKSTYWLESVSRNRVKKQEQRDKMERENSEKERESQQGDGQISAEGESTDNVDKTIEMRNTFRRRMGEVAGHGMV